MHPRTLAYLQLVRLPNVFTAVTDVLMGFLVVQACFQPSQWLYRLLLASCLLYMAGMILNDFFDYETDLKERPNRPLPSGRIDRAWAGKLGFGMLAGGVLVAWTVIPRAGIVATLLALAIYLYDGVAKKSWAGPVLMGSCRMLNVLLGMTANAGPLLMEHYLIAGGLGIYVMGITVFARSEATTSDRSMLGLGFAVMIAGIGVLASWAFVTNYPLQFDSPLKWPTLLILLMISVVRRCVIAIAKPDPANVQNAIKHAIWTLVVLDAAVVLAVLGPLYALAVIALLIPTVSLSRSIYVT